MAAFEFELTEAQVLPLQDGDTLVLRYPGRLSLDARARLMDDLEALRVRINKPGPIIILQEGASFEIVRAA